MVKLMKTDRLSEISRVINRATIVPMAFLHRNVSEFSHLSVSASADIGRLHPWCTLAGCGKTQLNCHSEEPAGDEESRLVFKTCRARSFAAAQDDSTGTFSRSLLDFRNEAKQRQ